MMRRGLVHEVVPHHPERHAIPLIDALRRHRRGMICSMGIAAFNASAFYLMLVYLTTYLETVLGEDAAVAFDINTVNMAILVVLIPVWGWISGRVGIQKVLVSTVTIALFATIPLFWLIDHKDPLYIFLGQFGMVMLMAPYLSCFGTRMAFLFPASVRMSAFSSAKSANFRRPTC
jgi:MHS family proline/betaine transporter-like MFS transporter